ncbi:anti sigma factor C-terminal domain-containing protein [Neobacillus sp. YIM B06451]|uniref:anti-sigma factor n=1 Tax=Neobacillus sp. YIM B06451 TaxID=3070994 RepID=UPI00292E7137|nr:anti sigma factor C-terminal domain-containing protein [Neobacillus sp. YIM B06451]
MTEWTTDKEKKILWKYRFTLTLRIVRVLLAIGFLYWAYNIILSIAYDQSEMADKNYFSISQAINWTQNGYLVKNDPFLQAEITPFLSQKLSLPLVRTIGKKEVQIGSVDVTKRLINPLSSKIITFTDPSAQSGFSFFLPEDPRTGKKLNLKVDPTVWSTLEKVHEGTVADFAFSTDHYYKPEELLKLLSNYDVDVLWMPLYAGELKEIKDVSYSVAGGTYFTVDGLGMARARETDDYKSYSEIGLHPDGIKENEKIMLANMEHLLESENKSYLENVLGLRFLQERHDYLKENGFRVYGAVVTGPVKELLKLRELKTIQSAQVGEFAYWNWTGE